MRWRKYWNLITKKAKNRKKYVKYAYLKQQKTKQTK